MATQIAGSLEQHVADSINAERAAAGLPALKLEVHLNASAQGHSDWMSDTASFSHTGEDGSSSTERIDAAGFPLGDAWRTSENIAYSTIDGGLGTQEMDELHEGLMNSPEHRANILDPQVSYLGVGLSVGNIEVGGTSQDAVYLTENFGETDGQVLVQEEVDGQTVLQAYDDGEAVGEPQPVDQVPDDDPQDPQEPDDPEEEDDVASAGCFVATAAYGSYTHPDVVALRRFKDEFLDRHSAGRVLVRFYWTVGPRLARHVSASGRSGRAVRALIAPLARLARRYG